MAKLSKLSRRLRRCFEIVHPRAALLDDAHLGYFAGMLEDDEASDAELEDALLPLILASDALEDENSAREICQSVLGRLRKVGNLTRTSSSSSSSSSSGALHRPYPEGEAVAPPLERTPSTSSAAGRARKAEVRGLDEWLDRVSLRHRESCVRAWCLGMGAAHVEEICEDWQVFCEKLQLRKLERKRVEKEVAARSNRTASDSTASLATATTVQHQCSLETLRSGSSGRCPRSAGSLGAGAARSKRQPPASEASLTSQRRSSTEAIAEECRPSEAERHCPEDISVSLPRVQNWESVGPPGRQYQIQQVIGCGATSKVHMCSRDEQRFAAKTISKSRFRMQGNFAEIMDRLHREMAILFSLRNSHIVSLFDVVDTHDKLYFIMEYVEGGELLREIVRRRAFAEHEARYVFLQIVLGLRYIHSKGVVHRDLKPENVLVDRQSSRPGLLEVKISDFGHSKLVDDGYSRAQSQVGTSQFWAPEVANSCDRAYDERADLWSLGVVLYIMLEGTYPFPDSKSTGNLVFKSNSVLSADARHLVQSLLQLRPHERLSLENCLRHPWVMTSSGPLSRVVEVCEKQEWSWHRQSERRVPLPKAPRNAKQLRRDLAALLLKFKLPVMLFHDEVRVRVGAPEMRQDNESLEDPEEKAWEELMRILERHYADGSFVRPDKHSLEVVPLDRQLAPVAEEDGVIRGESCLSLSSGLMEEELRQQDELIKVAVKTFPDIVEASEPGQTPRRVDLRLKLGAWKKMALTLLLPAGFPEVCAMQLESVSLFCPRRSMADVEGAVRDQIASHLEGPPLVPDIVEFISWLHEEIIPTLGGDGVVSNDKPRIRLEKADKADKSDKAGSSDLGDGANEASETPVAAQDPAPGIPPSPNPVRCGRLGLLTPHLDEKHDKTTKNQTFFQHIKHAFPDVSGLLSYGKPAVLVAEGPLDTVQKLKEEVCKSWWQVELRVFKTTEPLPNASAWRAFENFCKVKTDDVKDLCDRAGQRELYELLTAKRKAKHR